jgi:hypothetical protein
MILYKYLSFLFALVQFSLVTSGQSVKQFYKGDLFENDSVLELTIKMNCDSLYNGGFSESIEYKGVMSYRNDSDHVLMLPIKITKRGHFRKMYNVCNFPPLRIEFSKKTTKNSLFEGMEKIKMVTHCINGDSSFDQYVIEEYLIYKAYNIITDYSFKVRLAKINYVDISGKNPVMTRYAFFIENTGSLANRMKGTKLNYHYVYPEVVEQYHYCLAGIFQYMIYNTDWSINLLHNVELIGVYPSLRPVAVPFDFDMAGLINIPYNSPILAYKQGKDPERQFTIKKVNRKLIVAAVNRIKFKKGEILSLYKKNPYLSESNKVKTLGSLSSFFRILDDHKLVRTEFFK